MRGDAEVTTFAEFAIRARQQVAEIEAQERVRLAAEGVDAEEIEARMDCLRLGVGALVEGKRVDPFTVKMFYRDVQQEAEPRGRGARHGWVPDPREFIYRMAVSEDGSVWVSADA